MALVNTMRDADARTLTKSTQLTFDGVVKRFPTGTTALDVLRKMNEIISLGDLCYHIREREGLG